MRCELEPCYFDFSQRWVMLCLTTSIRWLSLDACCHAVARQGRGDEVRAGLRYLLPLVEEVKLPLLLSMVVIVTEGVVVLLTLC